MPIQIRPTCRYGHGDMELVTTEEPGAPDNGRHMFEKFPRHMLAQNQFQIFSFLLYRCPKCSYLELHDDFAPGEGQ
jgi:hypothetical protein